MSRPVKIGDRVRLRGGVLPWIGKRDGWTVEAAYPDTGCTLIGNSRVHVYSNPEDIEPDSPPIPAEPEHAVGQAWRDAEGQTVVGYAAPSSWESRYYAVGTGVRRWRDLAHPLTPLDPDDDEAVRLLAYASEVRAVLRALRGDA